jgi:hypothetical protein
MGGELLISSDVPPLECSGRPDGLPVIGLEVAADQMPVISIHPWVQDQFGVRALLQSFTSRSPCFL